MARGSERQVHAKLQSDTPRNNRVKERHTFSVPFIARTLRADYNCYYYGY